MRDIIQYLNRAEDIAWFEAAVMLQEMRERRFECLVIAPGRVIAADVKER